MSLDSRTLEEVIFDTVVAFKLNRLVTAMRLIKMYPDDTTKVALKLAARLVEVPVEDFTEERIIQELQFMRQDELRDK